MTDATHQKRPSCWASLASALETKPRPAFAPARPKFPESKRLPRKTLAIVHYGHYTRWTR